MNKENKILPLSNYIKDRDVYVGTPVTVGKEGVEKIEFTLDEEEKEKLENSISILRKYIEDVS